MPDITIPTPTSSHILWGGAVEIHCFGRPQNWSIAGATALAADMNNPGIRYRMHQLVDRYGLKRIYAPNPSKFNGIVAPTREFYIEWADERVLRGPFADGVLLTEPNTAFAVSSADCPTVVHHEPLSGAVVAAHAGLKSLSGDLVREMRNAMRPSRAGYQFLGRSFIACGISQRFYRFCVDDVGFNAELRIMLQNLMRHWRPAIRFHFGGAWTVDLARLFRIQAQDMMFHQARVGFDDACTYSDTNRAGDRLWHSNRRGDKTRNLVLVIRR